MCADHFFGTIEQDICFLRLMNEKERHKMKKYDYILVGSGLYSGVFAWYAKQHGKSCLVVEKRDHIGPRT